MMSSACSWRPAHNPLIAAAVEASEERSRQQLHDPFQAGIAAGEWPSHTDPNLAALLFTTGLYMLMARWHLRPGSFYWEGAAASPVGAAPRTEARRARVGWNGSQP